MSASNQSLCFILSLAFVGRPCNEITKPRMPCVHLLNDSGFFEFIGATKVSSL